MIRETFTITIAAPKEKVWDILWNDKTYPLWTTPFCEGSYAETDWKEGSKVRFLSPSGDGIVSIIAENRPHEFMSFRHLGEIRKGVEDITSEGVNEWAGALENYSLSAQDSQTILTVEMDITEKYRNYFLET